LKTGNSQNGAITPLPTTPGTEDQRQLLNP
jgi:hypothetical protein